MIKITDMSGGTLQLSCKKVEINCKVGTEEAFRFFALIGIKCRLGQTESNGFAQQGVIDLERDRANTILYQGANFLTLVDTPISKVIKLLDAAGVRYATQPA